MTIAQSLAITGRGTFIDTNPSQPSWFVPFFQLKMSGMFFQIRSDLFW